MGIRKLIRVYTAILVLGFVALALPVSSFSPAVSGLSFQGNSGKGTMGAGGIWLVQSHIAFPGNPGDPQGSHVTSPNFPTNPG